MMKRFFRDLHCQEIYDYQIKCAEAALQGDNLVIAAPTGAGKTWAALTGYLFSRYQGKPIADRLFYVLPMRTLANSLFQSVTDTCRILFDVTHDPSEKKEFPNRLVITIQTGERQEDPLFEGDIIFTTIDQFLSSYLNFPFSLPSNLSNINAGALIGALVVIDEVHLLDAKSSMQTLLEMIVRLQGCTQFILMSATLSPVSLAKFKEQLSGRLIGVSPEELLTMPSHKDKRRIYRMINTSLTPEHIIERHDGRRSIVICNSVSRAQAIYRKIKEIVTPETRLVLLHSRYFKKDRRQIEAQLSRLFGPDASATNAILITTQAVEVGVDISADNLHTELCPANSLIQRAGRCARYPNPRNSGTVWVYELECNAKGERRLGPYRKLETIINVTCQVLRDYDGQVLSYYDEQAIVDKVHSQADQRILAQIQLSSLRDLISKVIDNADISRAPDLIRNIKSVNIVITECPEKLSLDKLPELLSVPLESLFVLADHIKNSTQWVIKSPQFRSDDLTGDSSLEWAVLTSINELSACGWLIVISPQFASYSPEYGLQLGVAGPAIILEAHKKVPWVPYRYNYETFLNHIANCFRECRLQSLNYQCGSRALEQNLSLPPGYVNRLAELTTVLHDVGKLLTKWQSAALRWQRDYYPQDIEDHRAPVAHVTFWPENNDRAKQCREIYKRGSHPAEGAAALAEELLLFLIKETGNEKKGTMSGRAVLSAIARHHRGTEYRVRDSSFIPDALEQINLGLIMCNQSMRFSRLSKMFASDGAFGECLISAERDRKWLLLYWMLVRRVRLADQNSFAK